MKKTILIIVSVLLAQLGAWAQPYAVLEGDTLRMGNRLMERSFFWNGGAVRTFSITDKGSRTKVKADDCGKIMINLREENSFAIYKYSVLP